MKLFNRENFAVTIHIIIWVLLLTIPTIIFWNQTTNGLTQGFYFFSTLYNIGIFYFSAFFLYPRLLTKKYWWLYILSVIALIPLSFRLKVFLLNLNGNFHLTFQNIRVIFFGVLPFIIASIIFRLVSDRIKSAKLEKEANEERMATELKFLRSQVSPHFLFNMMTNMVSLARQKSELLEPSLIKLSELLRYMLYDSGEERIRVDKEIENLENYLALQHLRFGDDVLVESKIDNDCAECFVEPMLLIPFIENAFKHGIGLVKNPFIKIDLSVNQTHLDFKTINNYNDANLSKDKNSGIGLANVNNRLQLLYPGKHRLDIIDTDNIFTVHLKLTLS